MKNNNNSVFNSIALAITLFTCIATSCKDKDKDPENPLPINPQELITTVRLKIVDHADTSKVFTVEWKDPDGPGAQPAVIDTLQLDTGKAYHAYVSILDETKNPVDDVTEEIEAEKDEHQFFYTLSSNLSGRISINREDTDNNGLPLGLELHITTTGGPSVQGSLQVVLSHYDGIPKTTSPSPESDIDINIPVKLR